MEAGCSAIFLVIDLESHIRSRADPSTLTEPACEVHNNFPSPVIISDFKRTNVQMHKCFIITGRNVMMTLEHSLISTLLLPLFSALLILLRASAKTFTRPIMVAWKDGRKSPCVFPFPFFIFLNLSSYFLKYYGSSFRPELRWY